MQALQRTAKTLSIVAEITHIFCCGIPMTVAALNLGAQTGAFAVLHGFHDTMHDYEVPILIGSGILLLVALSLQYLSFWLDCRAEGSCKTCDCTVKKFKASRTLMLASALFVLNVVLFFTLEHEPHGHHDEHHSHEHHGHEH